MSRADKSAGWIIGRDGGPVRFDLLKNWKVKHVYDTGGTVAFASNLGVQVNTRLVLVSP